MTCANASDSTAIRVRTRSRSWSADAPATTKPRWSLCTHEPFGREPAQRLAQGAGARGVPLPQFVHQQFLPGLEVHLTPVALAEAMALIDQFFDEGKRAVDYDLIPTAVFTNPSVGTISMSEAEACDRLGSVRVFRGDFKALKNALSGNTERTLMKLVVDAATDRVVGLHMVGADAGEVRQGFAVETKVGATNAHFDATLGINRTAAEEFVTMRGPVG